ncbi:BTAD domain-containing putative transcriptional regulator [Nonomuraea sp. NPDC050556]|uniref:BTAD domain-containing putative transcriptional regulator n=1 Tax=Nonomuraea sp. NPDC050556 TaxID=3364369 RepID=UPI00379C749E
MRFGVLGPLEIRSADGEPISVGGPRPRALLVMLLLNAGHVVSVEQLIDGQYGEEPPAGAANAVQAQVSRLRRHLPDLIEFNGTGYRLAIDPDDVDVHRFERLVREGRHSAESLREALSLWRGEALADLPFGQAQAARLDELRLTAMEDLAEAELNQPEGTSVAELQRLVAEHPLRERLTGQLMRALHAAGRQGEALAAYERTRRVLADELGADPSPELAELHLALLRADRPRRRRPAAQLTSFVGREEELARLRAQQARLVTIVGPGGTGKTRLSVEAAPDGVFVDLSAGDQVAPAVLGALGVRDGGLQSFHSEDPVDRLVAALADQDVLLVLDNCEHVIDAAAALARTLLGECPRLRVLATSREPLGITGEVLVHLAPLTEDQAVRLFTDRARAVQPSFEVRPAVREICATLEGLPLAIELAAARLRTFGIDELATRLAEHGRFKLLSRGDRTAASRHQTLQAVVEWSWDLLTPAERELAARFSVFAGGASMEAVEAICGDLPDSLVDKSLVVAEGNRFRMSETVRLFCREKATPPNREHAAYFLDLAQRADPHLRRPEQLDWLARLSADHGNFLAALRWGAEHDRRTAMRLVAALAAYCFLAGRRGEVGSIASRLLGGPEEGLEEEYIMCVAYAIPRADQEDWDRAGEIIKAFDRALRYPFTAVVWGMSAGPTRTIRPDDPLLGADPWNHALIRLSETLLLWLGGVPAQAEADLVEVLGLFREVGERWGIAQGLDWLAELASWRGEWARAHSMWDEAIGLLGELGAGEEQADILIRRADARVRQGDLTSASADLALAADLSVDVSANVLLGRAEIARFRGDDDHCRALLQDTLAATREGFGADGMRAAVLAAMGRLDGDRACFKASLAAARASGLSPDLADATEAQAEAALLEGAGERAALLLGVAVAIRGTAMAGDPDVARAAAAARDLVGAEAFAAAYSRGASMTREEALTELSAACP